MTEWKFLVTNDKTKARASLDLHNVIAAETDAGLTTGQINTSWPVGHIYRYVTNTTPGTTDVTAGWQRFLSLGGVVDLDARVNDIFRITAQLVVKSGTTLRMGPDCVIYRDWSASAGDKYTNACFKNEHAPTISALAVDPGPWSPTTTDDDIYIEGGCIRPSGDTKIGCGYYLMGTTNLVLRDVVVERTYQDWAFAIGGENFSATGIRVEENAAVFEDGFHILYGSGVVDADYIHAGDDCFPIGSNWNLPVNGVDIRMGSFYSERAFAIKVIQNREGSTAGFGTPTSLIQNVRYHSGHGMAGVSRNGLVSMDATTTGLLADISVDGVSVDAGTATHDGTNPVGVYCHSVTRLKLRDVTAKNARGHTFHIYNCTDPELVGLVAKDNQGDSTRYGMQIQDCTNARVIGGEFTRTIANVINVNGTSTVVLSAPLVREIGNGLAGITVRDTAEMAVHGATFRKASGATSAIGILNVNSTVAAVAADGCKWDVDRPFSQSAAPAYAKLTKVTRTVTLASDAFTTYGGDYVTVLCQGGASDTLATISGGYKGQLLTLVNGETDPTTTVLTVTAGTGSNQMNIGSDYVLNTADAFLTVQFNGTNWILVAKGGTPAITLGVAGLTSTATAAGTTALTNSSTDVQIFTGSTTQTVTLPTTSVKAGRVFTIANQSTGAVLVQSSGGNTVTSLGSSQGAQFIALQATPTSNSHWIFLASPSMTIAQAASASAIAQRNSSGQLTAAGFIPSSASVTTAAGTTALTNASAQVQIFTGSTTQTVTLPTTSVVAGQSWKVLNTSSGAVTVNASGGALVATVAAGSAVEFFAIQATPTTAAHWATLKSA